MLAADDPVTLVGHSMGGKVAMVLALRAPELVERLCVVDVAPVDYGGSDEFEGYIEAMRGLDLDRRRTTRGRRRGARGRRAEPDRARLPAAEPAQARGRWLALAGQPRGAGRGSWPRSAAGRRSQLADATPYDGPVLWVAGADSGYIRPEHDEAMERLFPRHRRVSVKGAGHWVHSQQPEVFVEVLRRFIG